MKIKNESVNLKIGNKQYDFKNLIMDAYLKRFVLAQTDEKRMKGLDRVTDLEYCLLKFDTPLENISPSSIFYNQDFDACIVFYNSHTQQINENQIVVEYSYQATGQIMNYANENNTDNPSYISDFYGKKITAIGFNTWFIRYNEELDIWKHPVCSILDTSNYNIYLQENQEVVITRRDIIETDAIFYSNNNQKVPGPAHLAPYGLPQIIYQPNIYEDETHSSWQSFNDSCHGILYSVGFSSYTDYIDKEYIIGKGVLAKNNGTELIIKNIRNYLATDSSLFCDKNLYTGDGLYPIRANYKYIILKYKVWQYVHSGTFNNIIETPTDTGYYYHMAIPIDKFGNNNDLKIKYERG